MVLIGMVYMLFKQISKKWISNFQFPINLFPFFPSGLGLDRFLNKNESLGHNEARLHLVCPGL